MTPLQLDRPLVTVDIESTGTDVASDSIISLTAFKITPQDLLRPETRVTTTWLVNPGRPIPPASTKVHGITDAMVAGQPPFKAFAGQILAFIQGADLCGYNLRKFDVPLLWEEFFRASIEWSLEGVRIIDACEIFRRKEPRDLSAALKKYCGREHTGAHSSSADVSATWDVLNGQRSFYPDLGNMGVDGLAQFSSSEEWEGRPARRLDLAGYIIEDADGVARYTLNKVHGVAVEDDPGFAAWMLRNVFPTHTKLVLQRILSDQAPL